MNAGHDQKFDGLFGEEGGQSSSKSRTGKPVGKAPLAGMFGTRGNPFKQSDRKSPASQPLSADIDQDD